MATGTAVLMTADEFFAKHGGEPGVELDEGQLVRLPMPGMNHGFVCLAVGSILREFVRRADLGRVAGTDPFVCTKREPDSVRGPDVAFWSSARLPKEVPNPRGVTDVMPDLAVEVRSPSDRLSRLFGKASEYLVAGVIVVLIFDPETESVAICRDNDFPLRIHNGDELTLPDVLPGFSVRVREFFA